MRITEKFSPETFTWNGSHRNTGSQIGTVSIGHGSSTQFTWTYTFPSAGKIHFQYRVNSEQNYDFFWFNFDGTRITTISGSQGWFTFERDLAAGSHTLVFGYYTDGSVLRGENGGFITDFWVEHSGIDTTDMKATPSIFHKESVDVSFSLSGRDSAAKQAQYRIYTGAGAQLYPTSGYSPSVKLPYNAKHTIDATKFPFGSTTIYVETKDPSSTYLTPNPVSTLITRTNQAPLSDMKVVPSSVHKENATLSFDVTDAEKDSVQFKVSLNNVPIQPPSGDYSTLIKTPFSYTIQLRNKDMRVGNNTVTLTVMDDLGAVRTTSLTVKKVNDAVEFDQSDVRGQTLYARLTDPNGDMLRYQVRLNGKKIYPPDMDMTGLLNSPAYVNYKIPAEEVQFGNIHKVEIVAEDDLGMQSTWATNALIDYSGLMFTDENGAYYSTDIGEIIKLLDTGTVVAGNTTGTFKVYLKNTVGYAVKNVSLFVSQRDLDAVYEKVELSADEDPFIPRSTLEIPHLEYGERVPFYVRINTTRQAVGGGLFDIRVVGDPA